MSTSIHKNFSIKEAVNFGFKIAKENIVFFIGVFAIWLIIIAVSSVIQNRLDLNKQYLISLMFNIIMWIVNSIFSLGLTSIILKLADGKKPEIANLYYTSKLFNFMLASIIKAFIIVFGFILLIIPGIIFAIKLQYFEYFIVDKKMDAVDAIKASWEVTKNIKWNLFLFGIILMLINLLGILCLVVGLIITVPLTMIANAYVYRKLLAQSSLK